MICTKKELIRINLIIDLRTINEIFRTRKNIMASEYVELSLAKREIIKRLIKN